MEIIIRFMQMRSRDVKATRYWKKRSNSCLVWSSFVFLAVANVIDMVVFIVPGWGWTHESSSRTDLAGGEYYGFYGVWWGCWRLASYEGYTTCWPYHFVYQYPLPRESPPSLTLTLILTFNELVLTLTRYPYEP